MKLRILAAVVFASGGTALAAIVAQASPGHSGQTRVHISGKVTLKTGFTLQLTANARGAANALHGRGIDTTFHGNPGGPPPGTCVFQLTGSASSGVVTLSGTVQSSSNKALVGTPVSITGNSATRAIKFDFNVANAKGFGEFILTGTGIVHIRS